MLLGHDAGFSDVGKGGKRDTLIFFEGGPDPGSDPLGRGPMSLSANIIPVYLRFFASLSHCALALGT